MRARRLAAPLALLLSLPSCVNLDFFWIRAEEPVRPEVTARLLAARDTDLQACLDALGAPLRVWECADGIALSYGWLDRFYWMITVEMQFTGTRADGQRVFSYNGITDGYEGAVLVFGDDLNLRYARHGKLGDLTRQLKRRPRQIE